MKSLIITLALVGLCLITKAQTTGGIRSNGAGLVMTMGGIGLTIGGFTTRPDKYYTGNGIWQVKPFHKQGGRASAIVCGVSLTITGLITSIINAPKQRR